MHTTKHTTKMGVSSSQPDDPVTADLTVLASPQSSLSDKRAAFERMREHWAPSVARTQPYAEEVARVFALRYEGDWADGVTVERPAALAAGIRGVLYGMAMGDAAGLATEFLSKDAVREHYGDNFPFSPCCHDTKPDTHRMCWAPGDWTDDTDQALLLLQVALESGKDGVIDPCAFAVKLIEWHQSGFPALGDKGGAGLGKSTKAVITDKDFLTIPAAAATRVWESSKRSLAANGAVMRTPVLGAVRLFHDATVRSNTIASCTATHADPRCVASCVVIATLISNVLKARCDGNDDGVSAEMMVTQAAAAGAEHLPEGSDCDDFAHHTTQLRATDAFSVLSLDDPRAIGYTYKCMGSGVLAFLRCYCDRKATPDERERRFTETMRELIAEGGDADTNGAVAGAVMGAVLGYDGLPPMWIGELRYAEWLEAWVQKLLWMYRVPTVAPRHN